MSTHYLRLLRWHNQAACADADPNTFSPVTGEERRRVNLPQARQVARDWCAACPVIADCHADALHMASEGLPPQEQVRAGIWWPSTNTTDPHPITLLDPHPITLLDAPESEAA